jgi:hypothetical protein
MWAGCPHPASVHAASASLRLLNSFRSVFPPSVRQKLSLVLTLVAWLLATGSHWDLVQTFAWGRMIATYSQSMSFTKAVKKTFSVEGMCGVCVAVQDAKKQDAAANNTPGAPGKSLGKILLVFAPAPMAPLLLSSTASPWSLSDLLTPTSDPAAPPVPPPRALA